MSDQPKKQELPPLTGMRPERLRAILYWREPEYSTGVHVSTNEAWLLASQLLAALYENEAKDARIAELEQDRNRHACNAVELMRQRDAAEAKLKSVEGLLDCGSEDPWGTLALIREAIK